MSTPLRDREEALLRVAEAYRSQGYRVHGPEDLDALSTDLTTDLPWLSADLVAIRGDEHVIIQVATRTDPDWVPRMQRTAEGLANRSGWRLALVVSDSEPDGSIEAELPHSSRVSHESALAKRLVVEGESEAAIMVAWAAFEAALIHALAPQEPRAIPRGTPSRLKTALSLGLLSSEEHVRLLDFARHRNLVAHGFQTTAVQAMLAAEQVQTVIGLVPRLLKAAAEAQEDKTP